MADNAPHLAGLVDWLADAGALAARADLRVQPMLDNAARCAESRVDKHYDTAQIEGFLDAACERARARGMLFHVDMGEPFRRSVSPVEPRMRGIMPDLLCRMTDTIKQRYPNFCYMGATYMKIEPNGDVFPCCRGPKELRMGNTNEEPVEAIWNGERYRAFRKRMFAGDHPEVCRTCDHLIANPHFRGAPGG
jgi:radical SAM protein with 4Fe4S-binding SPASM domain